jgi:hypothetical protein
MQHEETKLSSSDRQCHEGCDAVHINHQHLWQEMHDSYVHQVEGKVLKYKSADTCLTGIGTESFTGEMSCLVGDVSYDFIGEGLSEINLSMTERAGFLTGVVLPH